MALSIQINDPRATSVEAYYKALDRGAISQKRWDALDILCRHAGDCGLTANEVWNIFKRENRTALNFDSNTRARFTELREMGLVRELGEKECSITGVRCIAWAPTWDTSVRRYVRKGKSAKTLRRALYAVWNHPDCTESIKRAIRESIG